MSKKVTTPESVEIVATPTRLPFGKCSPIVRAYLKKGYDFEWEEMIDDILENVVDVKEKGVRKVMSKRSAKLLRGAFKLKRSDWKGKTWEDLEILYIIEAIEFSVNFFTKNLLDSDWK